MTFIQKFIVASCIIAPYSANAYNLPTWIEDAVIYQIYPSSFQDSNDDGIGDLPGIMSRLDYIKSIGVNTIWLNPCFHSGFRDGGYDVIDFYRVAPRFGTNDDMRKLFEIAHAKGIRVILDLVVGHTSDQSPWFKFSQQKKKNIYSNRYIWTNDSSILPDKFVKGNFERNGSYLKNYFDCQPALNYGYGEPNPQNNWEEPVSDPAPTATRLELMNIINFWMQMGCDGFRIDMAGSLVKKDPNLVGTKKLWNEIRTNFESLYPKGILLAEWSAPEKAVKVGFMMDFNIHFGKTGYRNMLFNNIGTYRRDTCYFDIKGVGDPKPFINNLTMCLKAAGDTMHISTPTGNHDFQRPNCGKRNTIEQLRTTMAFFMTLPGVPTIYYGDEIGMKFIDNLPDKEGSMLKSGNRAGSRTPMQWDSTINAGFSNADINNFYLPIDNAFNRPNVMQQERDSTSMLNYVRYLLSLRSKFPALHCRGEISFYCDGNDKYPLVYERSKGSQRILICINPSGRNIITIRKNVRMFKHITPIMKNKFDKIQNIKCKGSNMYLSIPPLSVGIYIID